MIRGRRVLLTGGAGFIGSRLASRLVDHNQLVIFDSGWRNSPADPDLESHRNLCSIKGDVLDASALAAAAAGCQLVVHLAGIAGVDTVLRLPVETMKVNIIGTYHALEAARQVPGLERFVDFSTSEVFGPYSYKASEGDATSMGAVGEARWTYAVSKLAAEHLAYSYHKAHGVPAVTVRPFNVYGPGQVGEGAIHRFIVQALKGEDLTIHNDGSQIRAWCYIDDIVDAVLRCLEVPEAVGHAFNIGNPRSVCTIYDLARHVVRISGSGSKLAFVEWPHPDVELRVPNTEKARRLLGWEPRVDLDTGLARTLQYFREKLAAGETLR